MKNIMHNRYIFCLFFALIGIVDFAYAQNTITVKGLVRDAMGEPVIGATVVVVNSTVGTTTDLDGKFQLDAPRKSVIKVSYIGMKSFEFKVSNKSFYEIQLEDESTALNEVVVIGYGTQSKATVTSGIESVKAEELSASVSASPLNNLQGKVAGLDIRQTTGQPGAQPIVLIRGGSTNPAKDTPLFVIDGVICENMNGINQEDIESMQVLKDAASSAIYGARGANGIILITTKQGKTGKARVSASYRMGIEKIREHYPFSNARDYLYASRLAGSRGINDPNIKGRLKGGAYPYSTGNINYKNGDLIGYGYSRFTTEYLDDLIENMGREYVDNLLTHQGYETMTDPYSGRELIFKDNNYQKDVLFQTGITHNYDVNVSGGTDKANYYVSMGYIDAEGMVLGTGYDRFSLTANGNYSLRDNLKLSMGVKHSTISNQGTDPESSGTSTLDRSSRYPTTFRLYYDDGTPGIGESGGSPRSRLHELYYQDITDKAYRNTFQLGLDWEIVSGLHFKPTASYYMQENIYKFYESYNQFNKGRKTLEQHSQDKQVMADAILTYDKTFAQKHTLNSMIGMNYTVNTTYFLEGSGREAGTDHIHSLAPSKPEEQRATSKSTENRLLGFFARVNYDYMRRYLFSVSLRYDGASQFTEGNRFTFFPAVSAGWNMHYENWFPKDIVSRLKLRASWGKTGNNNLTYSDTQGEYAVYPYGGNGGILNSVLANNKLIWETTSNVDIGFDAGFFDNRLELSATGYNKLTTDRLYDKSLPAETGFEIIKANLGTVQNKGIEITLTVHPLSTSSPLKWDITGSFSLNRTYMKKLPYNGRDKNRVQGGIVFDPTSGKYIETGGLAEGERIGGRWGYKYLGIYDTDEAAANAPEDKKVSGSKMGKAKQAGDAIWADLDNNGVIDDKDITFIGWANPDKKGALINSFSYKNFSLRFVMDFALGHSIANIWRCRANANARNAVITTDDVTNGNIWWNPGDAATAKYPRYDNASDWDNGYRNHMRTIAYAGMNSNGNADNTAYYSKGDYLCFREITLGYDLPKSVCGKLGVSGVSLSAGINNIGYITAFDGLNPEQYDGSETGEYFIPIQFNFGARLTF